MIKLKFMNLKLSHRLFLIIVLFFLLPYILLYFYSYQKAEVIIKDKLNQITSTDLAQIGNLIEDQCVNVANASEYLISMDTYKSLYSPPQNKYQFLEIYQKTDELVQNVNNSLLNGKSYISILAEDKVLYSTVPLSKLNIQPFFSEVIVQSNHNIENNIFFSSPHDSYISSSSEEKYVSCIRKVSNFFSANTDLHLIISTPISVFADNLNISLGSVILTDSSNNIIANNGTSLSSALIKDVENNLISSWQQEDNTNFSFEKNGFKALVNCFNLKTYNWKLFSIIDTSDLYKDIYSLRFFVGIVSLILILICTSITFYFIYHQLKPLFLLKEHMESVSRGDLDVNLISSNINSKDEISVLTQTFNNMIDKINQLIEQKQVAQKRENELHFEMLLAQINPHFLFNTLNSIKWMSIVAHTDNITATITSLGRLLEISMNKSNDRLTIEDEITNIKSYSHIQQIRYPGRFEILYYIDSGILKLYTLKLVLQPIVENSIIHNIEYRDFLTITISGECINDIVILKIRDNGIGVSKEYMHSILHTDRKQKSSHVFNGIGVSNVHERIQLEYGSNYGLHYESDGENFTEVSVTFPKITTLADNQISK